MPCVWIGMRFLLALVLVVGACTNDSTPSASSPSSTPSAASAPRVAVTVSPPTLGLACRLPITWVAGTGQAAVGKAGFLTFPGLQISEDVTAPPHSAFYDRGYGKWLPVGRDAVSNDGAHYAYTTGNGYQATGTLHVVDVATGIDRTIYNGGPVFRVVDFENAGIYLTGASPEGRAHGLWLENPAGGAPRQISNVISDPAVGGGAAFGTDYDASDPSPAPGGLEGPHNRILRFDLQSGASVPLITIPGADIYMAGADAAGHVFVYADRHSANNPDVNNDTEELWMAIGPGDGRRLYQGLATEQWPYHLAAIDSHGTWFDGGNYQSRSSAWLYSNGSIQLAASLGLTQMSVAGGCINTA